MPLEPYLSIFARVAIRFAVRPGDSVYQQAEEPQHAQYGEHHHRDNLQAAYHMILFYIYISAVACYFKSEIIRKVVLGKKSPRRAATNSHIHKIMDVVKLCMQLMRDVRAKFIW